MGQRSGQLLWFHRWQTCVHKCLPCEETAQHCGVLGVASLSVILCRYHWLSPSVVASTRTKFCLWLEDLLSGTLSLSLKTAETIDYKLGVLVYKCRLGPGQSYLADELREPADIDARCRLHSTSSSSLVIRHTRLSTVGDQAFPVVAARVWNSLLQHVTSAQSLPVFHSRLKTYLFRRCFLWLCCCAWEVTLSFSDTFIVFLTYLLTYNWLQNNIYILFENMLFYFHVFLVRVDILALFYWLLYKLARLVHCGLS